MARLESWFNQDINEAVKVQNLDGVVFSQDNKANLVGVRLFDKGSPVTVTGTCTGYCITASGLSIPVVGSTFDNCAYIVLPDSAYEVPGPINIIIKIINGSVVTTVGCVVSTVFGISGVVSDPGQQTIDAWTAQINAAIAAVQGNSVRYDTSQSLTSEQKHTARENIGVATSATLISGDDYKLTLF